MLILGHRAAELGENVWLSFYYPTDIILYYRMLGALSTMECLKNSLRTTIYVLSDKLYFIEPL